MTAEKIRAQVSPMVVAMAGTAIREARRAISGKTMWNDVKRQPFNLPEVEMAGEVLFYMFDTFTASIKDALLAMPEKLDGCFGSNLNYFDEFIKALDKRLHSYSKPKEVVLRKTY